MTALKILARALTTETPGGYQITLETDDGQVFEVFATETQIGDLGRELLGLADGTGANLTPEQEVLTQEKSS